MSPSATTRIDELLRGTVRSALHLEMRDGYMQDDPALRAWRDGHRLDPADRASWWRPWLDVIAETVGRGVEIRRARIVSEPVSEYIRYEYDVTFPNVAAGEQVRWLPRRNAGDIPLPGNDFWLFDGRLVRWGHFSGDGDSLGGELTEDPAAVRLCADAFEQVWDRAIPHDKYTI
ncbi:MULTISPECIES: DUF6879 family protein [Kitasatospora]|uniref:DUF6879 domain-containing protein n=1 Tax=Kitasatospora setae (strain ATCC 33774 / DSM 43861 / JCM 3304 / KCC A-0304 / NBRC 14216 / KM-6054) TaxID=452652 RepID=E4N0L5_KITSK|nr:MULTISPECIES: DUF6879 family protein [Kitasatospora]BAJ31699.1 hypothetical protein KSE_59290 [Kitasatospora setae KM-6054]